MSLEQTISNGVDTAFTAAGDQVRTLAMQPPVAEPVYNDVTDEYTGTPPAAVPATGIRYEGRTEIDGVEHHLATYLVRTKELAGSTLTTAWRLYDSNDSDVEGRAIVKVARPHTTIYLIYVASRDATTT